MPLSINQDQAARRYPGAPVGRSVASSHGNDLVGAGVVEIPWIARVAAWIVGIWSAVVPPLARAQQLQRLNCTFSLFRTRSFSRGFLGTVVSDPDLLLPAFLKIGKSNSEANCFCVYVLGPGHQWKSFENHWPYL